MSMRRKREYGMSKREYTSQAYQFKSYALLHYGIVLRTMAAPYKPYFYC